MANEPERPIEKLLRGAANRRRDEAGAPFELHPANRRVLQGEVARTFAAPRGEPRSFAAVVARLWPRFAWAVGLLAVLGVATWLLLPAPGKAKAPAFLARNAPASEAAPADTPAPPPVAAPATVAAPPAPVTMAEAHVLADAMEAKPAPTTPARQLAAVPSSDAGGSTSVMAKNKTAESFGLATASPLFDRQNAPAAQLTASSAAPAPAPAGAFNETPAMRLRLADKDVLPASPPSAPVSPPVVTVAPADGGVATLNGSATLPGDQSGQPGNYYQALAAAASANRPLASHVAADALPKDAAEGRIEGEVSAAGQRFFRVAPEGKAGEGSKAKGLGAQPVLASFQVEQAGRELRIVDGDGSVYRGYLQVAGAVRRTRPLAATAPAASPAPSAPAAARQSEFAATRDTELLGLQTYSFRVAGTNLSLRKKVVFTGNLLAATNPLPTLYFATNLSLGGSLRGAPAAGAPLGYVPVVSSRIFGKVTIGSGKPVEINALPAKP